MDMTALAETMPDFVKLTVVGIGIDPPVIDDKSEPMFRQTLDYFVKIGVCVAVRSRDGHRYHLTQLGCELRDIVAHDEPRDATLPANDDYPVGPDAA